MTTATRLSEPDARGLSVTDTLTAGAPCIRSSVLCPDHGLEPFAVMLAELRHHHKLRQGFVRDQTACTLQARATCRSFVLDLWRAQGRDPDFGVAADKAALTKTSDTLFTAAEKLWKDDIKAARAAVSQKSGGKGLSAGDTLVSSVLPPGLTWHEFDMLPDVVEAISPRLGSRAMYHEAVNRESLAITKRAALLPVKAWAEALPGLGLLSLGQIIAETGNLDNYASPAKVWQMMELGLVHIDGEWTRQKRVSGDNALLHKYAGHKRAIMAQCADHLIMHHGYRDYYLAEKERQQGKLPDKAPKDWNNRAKRMLAKRLLRELWRAWTGRGVEWEAGTN